MKNILEIKIALCCVVLLTGLTTHGQETQEFSGISNLRWKGAYLGESMIHPGLKVGVEKTFKSWLKTKDTKRKKRPTKERFRELFLEGNISGFNVPNSEFNFSINAGVGYRRTNEKGKFFSPVLTAGVTRYFYNIPTYELGETEPRKINGAGRNAYAVAFGIEWGRNLFISSGKPFSWYIKPALLLTAPYNHSYNITTTVEAGVILQYSFLKGK